MEHTIVHLRKALTEADARLRQKYRAYTREGTDEAWARYYNEWIKIAIHRVNSDLVKLHNALPSYFNNNNSKSIYRAAKRGELGSAADTRAGGPFYRSQNSPNWGQTPSQRTYVTVSSMWGHRHPMWPSRGYIGFVNFFYLPGGTEGFDNRLGGDWSSQEDRKQHRAHRDAISAEIARLFPGKRVMTAEDARRAVGKQ